MWCGVQYVVDLVIRCGGFNNSLDFSISIVICGLQGNYRVSLEKERPLLTSC